MPKKGGTNAKIPATEGAKRRPLNEKYEVERVVSGPRILDGAYLIKWSGYPVSQNTWEPRSHLPESVFEDDSDPLSFPFEVIATTTASANAAALAAHKLSLTPKPRNPEDVFSHSSEELPSSHDEWQPSQDDSLVPEDDEVGEDTDAYPENFLGGVG